MGWGHKGWGVPWKEHGKGGWRGGKGHSAGQGREQRGWLQQRGGCATASDMSWSQLDQYAAAVSHLMDCSARLLEEGEGH